MPVNPRCKVVWLREVDEHISLRLGWPGHILGWISSLRLHTPATFLVWVLIDTLIVAGPGFDSWQEHAAAHGLLFGGAVFQ